MIRLAPVGVDLSERAIEHARQNAHAADVDVRFRAMDVHALSENEDGNVVMPEAGAGMQKWSGTVLVILRPGGQNCP